MKYLILGFILGLFLITTVTVSAHYHYPCEDKCEITPTIEITPTVEPTIEPSVSPTEAPLRTDLSDNKSDGKSDGLSSCPSCTQAPKDNYPRSNYDGAVVPWK